MRCLFHASPSDSKLRQSGQGPVAVAVAVGRSNTIAQKEWFGVHSTVRHSHNVQGCVKRKIALCYFHFIRVRYQTK